VPHRAAARDGTAAPARRSARRGPARARGVGFDREKGERLFCPSHRASEAHPSAGPERHLPCPANGQGYGGLFPFELLAAPIQKGQAGVARTPSYPPPLGVFSFTTAPFAPDWRKERARRHRVAPGKGGAGSRTRAGTPTPPGTPPLVGRKEGRSRRRKEPDRSREPYAAGKAYYSTPSPFSTRLRLHRRPDVSTTAATLSLSSLLELCSVLRRRCWGASSCRLAWLPTFEPQDCRVAFVWSSRATHAPGPADAMRGPFVGAGLRAKHAVQECCAPPCRLAPRSGYQTTAPGERARTRERNARLGPARVRRAPCWATGQPSRQGRRRGALSSRGVSDPYSPPTRVARLIGLGFDPCVIADARRGAAP
jgi:hypothetical protein